MKARYLWIVAILATTMLAGFIFTQPAEAATQYGARADYSLFFYADETVLYTALKAGTIDVMMWELTSTQVYDAITDPALTLIPVPRYDMRAWSLHLNWTTTRVPGWGQIRNPLSQKEFRLAVSHCADRAYYTQVVCGGFAIPTYAPITTNSIGWWNLTTRDWVLSDLAFDVDAAKADLAAGGWVDTDSNGIVNFPAGWEGASGQDMVGIRLAKRMDDQKRRDAMTHFQSKLTEAGIAFQVLELMSAAEASPVVMTAHDFHIYAAGWSMGRFPVGMYGWFHSSRYLDDAYSTNYHTGWDSSHNPAFPALDPLCDAVFYPVDLPSAKIACQGLHDYVMRNALFIPLWCSYSYYAYKNCLGLTNEAGYGPEYTNSWFPINGYRADNPSAPIRVGIKNPPVSLNYVLANWVWEVSIFSRFMDSFLDLTPYNVVVDWPWSAYDWDNTKWVDPDTGTNKTLVKYYLRQNQTWIAPINGTVLRTRNAYDHPFHSFYYAATTAAIPYTAYRDVKYMVTPNAYEVDVYFDSLSYWNWLNPFGRDFYPEAWKMEPISHLRTDTWIEGTNMTTPTLLSAVGNRAEGTPIEIVSMTLNSVPMTMDTTPYLATHTGDYAISGSTANGPKIRIFRDCNPGDVLVATYWARGDYSGNLPGGRPWNEVLIGSGAHYISELNNVMGGWCTFKANRNHWMTTPPLGEIDFAWYQNSGPIPRGGYVMIDILDVVKCTAAYDSTGNGAVGGKYPSANWEPGADLAVSSALIDIFDVVTITGKYETTFWAVP